MHFEIAVCSFLIAAFSKVSLSAPLNNANDDTEHWDFAKVNKSYIDTLSNPTPCEQLIPTRSLIKDAGLYEIISPPGVVLKRCPSSVEGTLNKRVCKADKRQVRMQVLGKKDGEFNITEISAEYHINCRCSKIEDI